MNTFRDGIIDLSWYHLSMGMHVPQHKSFWTSHIHARLTSSARGRARVWILRRWHPTSEPNYVINVIKIDDYGRDKKSLIHNITLRVSSRPTLRRQKKILRRTTPLPPTKAKTFHLNVSVETEFAQAITFRSIGKARAALEGLCLSRPRFGPRACSSLHPANIDHWLLLWPIAIPTFLAI